MGKGRKGKKHASPGPAAAPVDGEDPEAADIAATLSALGPAIDAGVGPHRLASACGAHPDDLRGFLDGRISLTPALRKRLRDAVPSLLDALDPRKQG